MVDLAARGLVADPRRGLLYASVASDGGMYAGEVVAVETGTGRVAAHTSIGHGPDALGLASDGSLLWVGTDDDQSVRSIDVASGTLATGPAHPIPPEFGGTTVAGRIVGVPESPRSIVIILENFSTSHSVAVLDDGIARATWASSGSQELVAASSTRFYSRSDGSTESVLNVIDLEADGLHGTDLPYILGGFDGDLAFADGFLYGGDRPVIDARDPANLQRVGALAYGGFLIPLPGTHRIIAISGDRIDGTVHHVARLLDTDTYLAVSSVELTGLAHDGIADPVHAGPGAIAFRSIDYRGAPGPIYVVHHHAFGGL
jgi:hypothetical protein